MIYDFSITTGKGEQLNLADYKGKVIMVVNTATGCGFTPQYAPIEQLYRDYHDQGLEILDIPCNQFGGQAPGTDDEIHEFCTMHFNTTFPQMKKADVNGENELPLYTWLKSQKGFEGFDEHQYRNRISSGISRNSLSTGLEMLLPGSSQPLIWSVWRIALNPCFDFPFILSFPENRKSQPLGILSGMACQSPPHL